MSETALQKLERELRMHVSLRRSERLREGQEASLSRKFDRRRARVQDSEPSPYAALQEAYDTARRNGR